MEANQTFINAIINSVVNLVITRIGELGLVSDIHKRLDDIEKKVDERKPELEQSLEMLLQQSTWFGDLIAKQVDMSIEEQDLESRMQNIVDEALENGVQHIVTHKIDNYDFQSAVHDAVNDIIGDYDFSDEVSSCASDLDLVSDDGCREIFEEMFDERFNDKLKGLTVSVQLQGE